MGIFSYSSRNKLCCIPNISSSSSSSPSSSFLFFFLHCYRYSGHSTPVFSVLYMTERLISDFTSLYFLSVKVDLFCSFPAADFYSSARAALHGSRILIFHLTLDPDASLNFIICLKQPIITPLSLTQPLIGSLYIHLLCMYKIYL